MSYKQEMQNFILELHEIARTAKSEQARELAHRRAEIIDFLINHPKDALAALMQENES